ncbi:MAG: competence/damage-inducible protein A [Gammaproteobacteria bacterium]|nr:competence/damage-inducible protein A [Gammaproteobacteria bacterium]
MNEETETVRAAAILIGNELLSGRIADENMHYIANALVDAGIVLAEVRVIPDDCELIVKTVRELKEQVDYVFTTGGIGPTHDDITAECIAKAFEQPLIQHPQTADSLRKLFAERGVEANAERMRMANMPQGAVPLLHKRSPVPGFRMENVYVLAGVPVIMRSMLDAAIPELKKGKRVHSASVRCDLQEGTLAKDLALIQQNHKNVDIGSYPLSKEYNHNVSLVVRGVDPDAVRTVSGEIKGLIVRLGGQIISED